MSIPNINNNIETQPFNQSVKGFIQDLKKKVDTIVQRVLNHINRNETKQENLAHSCEQWFTNNNNLVSKPLTLNPLTSLPPEIAILGQSDRLGRIFEGDQQELERPR